MISKRTASKSIGEKTPKNRLKQIPKFELSAVIAKLRQIDERQKATETARKSEQFAFAKCQNATENSNTQSLVQESHKIQISKNALSPSLLSRERQAYLELALGNGILRLKANKLELHSAKVEKAQKAIIAKDEKRITQIAEQKLVQNNAQIAERNASIIGTSEALEKSYFRLTAQPNPTQIRPERVLKRAFAFVSEKFKRGEADNIYILDQLRAIRQDLLVQNAQSEFTALVYETNFELALEHGDQLQMTECLSQLLPLYQRGIGGRSAEFQLYRALHLCFSGAVGEVQSFLARADRAFIASADFAIVAALLESINNGDFGWALEYARSGSARLVRLLFALFADRMRVWALRAIAESWRALSLSTVAAALRFDSPSAFERFARENALPFAGGALLERAAVARALDAHRYASPHFY